MSDLEGLGVAQTGWIGNGAGQLNGSGKADGQTSVRLVEAETLFDLAETLLEFRDQDAVANC